MKKTLNFRGKVEEYSRQLINWSGYLFSIIMLAFTVWYATYLPIVFDSVVDIFFIFSALVYAVLLIYAATSKSILLLSALSVAPAVLVASLIEWEYKEFVEQYLLKPVFGSASVIGVIANHFKEVDRKKADKAEAEAKAKAEEAKVKAEEIKLKRQEILMYDIQRSLQNREMEFKLTIEFRNKVIQNVISYLAPIPKNDRDKEIETEKEKSYSSQISEAKRLVYDVFMYFDSITLVESVIKLINKHLSGSPILDDDILKMIHEFRKRLDFQHEEFKLKTLAKKVAEKVAEKVTKEIDIIPEGLSKKYIENLVFVFFLKEGIPNYKDVLKGEMEKPLKREEAESKLKGLIEKHVDDLVSVLSDSGINFLNEKKAVIKKEVVDIIVSSKVDKKVNSKIDKKEEAGSIENIRSKIERSFAEMVKAELGLKSISECVFLRLARRYSSNKNNHHDYSWLHLRLSSTIKDWDRDCFEDQIEFKDIKNKLVFVWARNNKKIGSALLGLFVIDKDGDIVKRVVRKQIMTKGFLLLSDSGIPNTTVDKLLDEKDKDKRVFQLDKDFISHLPNVFDALKSDGEVNKISERIVVEARFYDVKKEEANRIGLGKQEVQHVKKLVVKFRNLINTNFLSYVRHLLDQDGRGILFSYDEDMYKLHDFSLHDPDLKSKELMSSSSGNNGSSANGGEPKELSLIDMHDDVKQKILGLNVHLILIWSQEYDINNRQDHTFEDEEGFPVNITYNPNATLAQVQIKKK